jgi:hypothetical protein
MVREVSSSSLQLRLGPEAILVFLPVSSLQDFGKYPKLQTGLSEMSFTSGAIAAPLRDWT